MKYHYNSTEEGKRTFKKSKGRVKTSEPQTRVNFQLTKPQVKLSDKVNVNVNTAWGGKKLSVNPQPRRHEVFYRTIGPPSIFEENFNRNMAL
jgi:hypothetical protein